MLTVLWFIFRCQLITGLENSHPFICCGHRSWRVARGRAPCRASVSRTKQTSMSCCKPVPSSWRIQNLWHQHINRVALVVMTDRSNTCSVQNRKRVFECLTCSGSLCMPPLVTSAPIFTSFSVSTSRKHLQPGRSFSRRYLPNEYDCSEVPSVILYFFEKL